MKLAFSSNAFKANTLEQAIDAIAAAGYAGVEIMTDTPHALPGEMPPRLVAAVGERLARLGLGISNLNAFTLFADGDTYHPTWIEPESALIDKRIAHTLAVIDLAAALGAPCISLQPGGPMEDDARRDEYLALFRRGLERVLPAAEAAGVTLAIEPEPGLLIESAAEYLDFVADFQHPALACNCDVGHLYCVDEDPPEAIAALGEHIAHVHLEDIAPTRVHQHLVPGTGGIDFPAVFAALASIGYDGFVTVELYPYVSTAEAVAREAMAYLRDIIEP